MKKNIIVLIPARGGSKRFPKKNVYLLDGKPLIHYPIEAARAAKLVNRVVVTTDSPEIAEVAKRAGAEVPFLRPAELATDESPVIEAIQYTLERLASEGDRADYILLLQPASPLISSDNIDALITAVIEKNADSGVAVSLVDTLNHPYNIRTLNEEGNLQFWQDALHYEYLRKAKPKFYKVANIWLSSYKTIVEKNKLEGENNIPLIVDPIYSLDIDYKEDLELIEAWLQYQKNKGDGNIS